MRDRPNQSGCSRPTVRSSGLTPREVTKAYVSAEEPTYAVTFSNGASLSVEFRDDALSAKRLILAFATQPGDARKGRDSSVQSV